MKNISKSSQENEAFVFDQLKYIFTSRVNSVFQNRSSCGQGKELKKQTIKTNFF